MRLRLKRCTENGMEALEAFVEELRASGGHARPPTVVEAEDVRVSGSLVRAKGPPAGGFGTRYELGLWLLDIVPDHLARERTLWAWLTLRLLDLVCPPREDGSRKVGGIPRLLPRLESYRHFYRHLLAGPFLLCRLHREATERVRVLLCQPLDRPGEVYEQLASRQDIVTSRAALGVARRLYLDESRGGLRRGAQGKAPGTPRRLAVFLQQLMLTHDIQELSEDRLLGLLPAEFDRFKEV